MRFQPIVTSLERPGFRAEIFEDGSLSGGTHYGIALGRGALCRGDRFPLQAGMYFVVSGPCAVEGRMLVTTVPGDVGVFQLGGPPGAHGRLRYIDGCTDTLLVCPPRLGLPCLNHLHIPPGTRQSVHTHPSDRVGIIVSGRGRCVTADASTALAPGLAWWIPAGLAHAFYTDDDPLDVLAWHPDSDFGPTDEDHPMVNRTILR